MFSHIVKVCLIFVIVLTTSAYSPNTAAGFKGNAAKAAAGYALVKIVPTYLKSKSPAIKAGALHKIKSIITKHPSLIDKALIIGKKYTRKFPKASKAYDKLISKLKQDVSLPPPVTAALKRASAGTPWGTKGLKYIKDGDKWLKGSHGNAGLFPKQIAEKMQGKTFKDFNEFREVFWKEVANDLVLSKGFNNSSLALMKKGMAPAAHASQHVGKLRSYVLHHRTPISKGGPVYDFRNLAIVTPKFHQSILDKLYHFGK